MEALPGDPATIQQTLASIPAQAWTPAYDADGQVRPGAWVTELTGLFDFSGWPPGMRLIVRKERPHTGAQLRITDLDGYESPRSSPTPSTASWPTLSCDIAAGPGPRTASAA